ncbi:hypothetical protein ACFZAU_32135 [Streptomyces sp. NPDC008238]
MTGAHGGGDGPVPSTAPHAGTPGEPPMQRLLRTARVYAQAVLDVVVLGAGTDGSDGSDDRDADRGRAARPDGTGPPPARGSGPGSSAADR